MNDSKPEGASFEILSALLDGEDVDPLRLVEALDGPGALDAIRSLAIVRAAVRADGPVPSRAFYARMSELASPASRFRSRPSVRRLAFAAVALAAAAVLVVGVVPFVRRHGEVAGGRQDGPPAPDRVVTFTPGVDWSPR